MFPALAIVLSAAFVAPERTTSAPCPTGEEILWSDAIRCVGETRRVVGRVDGVFQAKSGNLYFNFCADYRGCPFQLVAFAERTSLFADAAMFIGNEVIVTGRISRYRNSAQIVLTERSQLALKPAIVRRPIVESPEPPPVVAPVEPEAASDGITPESAAKRVGERVRVSARVESVRRRGEDLVVSFDKAAPLLLVVLEPFVPALESTSKSWVGARIEVEGEVTVFDASPAIFVTDAADVRVLTGR